MSSNADKQRRQKAKTQARALQVATERANPDWQPPLERPRRSGGEHLPTPRKKAGLVWLHDKDKISLLQRYTGERFGRDLRISWIQDGMALRSSLDILEVRGGGGGAALLSDYTAMILEKRRVVDAAQSWLHYEAGVVATLTLICGRELTPWEALELRGESKPSQADVAEVETTLRTGLNMLAKFYAELDSK